MGNTSFQSDNTEHTLSFPDTPSTKKNKVMEEKGVQESSTKLEAMEKRLRFIERYKT